jgi:hypothetical protein
VTETAIARFNPFEGMSPRKIDWTPGMSLGAIARLAEAPEWFFEHGTMRVQGRAYERALWPHIKPKPGMFVELCATVHGGKSSRILLTLAAVALTVVTAGIGAGVFGATIFGVSSQLVAAGLGVVGQLALNALTPAPKLNQGQDASAQRELNLAGSNGNVLQINEPIAGLIGRRRMSPQVIVPPYVTLEREKLWVHQMVGCMGRCLVEDVQINDLPWADVSGAVVEVFEGDGSGAVSSFLSDAIRVMDQQQRGKVLANFDLREEGSQQVFLADQITPDKAKSPWVTFLTRGLAHRLLLRCLFESGIVSSTTVANTSFSVAFRIEVRQVGSPTWKKLPVVHVADVKTSGAFRQDIELIWGADPGIWVNNARVDIGSGYIPQFNIPHAMWRTGFGETFAYDADSYFDPASTSATAELTPVMTSNALGGITVSASHNNATAWQAVDGNATTSWSPPANVFGPGLWWQIDWGAGNEKAVGRYNPVIDFGDLNHPGKWELYGSQDGVNFTLLDTYLEVGSAVREGQHNLASTTAYRFHRLVILDNAGGAAGNLDLRRMRFMTNRYTSTGPRASQNIFNTFANNVSLNSDGVKIYLDPNNGWPVGDYEVRIRRSWAYETAEFNVSSGTAYLYETNAGRASFFDYDLSSEYRVYKDQKPVQSKVIVEDVMITENKRPIRADVEARLTRIAVRVPDITLNSVSARLTRYARIWNGAEWADTPVPTRNPAAHYRDALLLAENNAMPLPGEILEEASLQAFYNWCVTNNFTCDAIVQGRSVSDILNLCTSVARASPRRADRWGVVIDRDRSADPVTALLTPETSQDLGTELIFNEVPQALRVTYQDEGNTEKQAEITVYRDGYSAANADRNQFQAVNYDGIATLAAATAQATYDLRQMLFRKLKYKRKVGIEGLDYERGELFKIADEVVMRHSFYGLVKGVTTSAGNVTGVTLYSLARLSDSAAAISDTEGALGTFGCSIRRRDGSCFTTAITEQADTTSITFAAPVVDTGQFALDQPIAIGPLGVEAIRAILKDKSHSGDEEFTLTLLPEAPAIFAP